jgi:uncharacterized lipoprotein YajG
MKGMHKMSLKSHVLGMLILLSGCAYVGQTVELAPKLAVAKSDLGAGKEIALRVVDERSSQSLGNRSDFATGPGAEIRATKDVAETVREEVQRVLQAKGFKPTTFSTGAPRSLTLELRRIDYTTSSGLMSGGVHIKGAIKATARREGESFERMYRVDTEERFFYIPTAETNSEKLNQGLSALLSQIADDEVLQGFLAGR